MKQKLIFFDIDGTLIDHFKKEIPKSTVIALEMLQKNNHIVAIASGKGPVFIEQFLPRINFATYVALNGNYVVHNNEIVAKNYLDGTIVKSFVEYCLANDIPFTLADVTGTATLFKANDKIRRYYNHFSLEYPMLIDNIDDFTKFFQMSIMIEAHEEEIVLKFKELTFVRMSKYGMNVVMSDGLKEKGIQKILELSPFTKEDIIVFGDGLNDIGMFKLAQTSVAMGNANEQLKRHATFTTDHISSDGIYNACRKLGLF